MPATIVRQRKLRIGELRFSADTASDVDQYVVKISERTDKKTVAELFVAYTSGSTPNPVPKATLKQLGASYLICDSIEVSPLKEKMSLHWLVTVNWKELEGNNPENQTSPTPNSNSTDPDDWTPSWSRRTQIIFEPATDGFYKGGFPDNTRGKAFQESFGASRAPIQNSAGDRFDTGNEIQRRRRVYVWNFRWFRATIPANLMDKEGKANSVAFSFARNGRTFTFAPATAIIDSIELSKHRWGTTNLAEISMEVVHDPQGIYWKIRDQGFNRRAEVGDKDNTGLTINGATVSQVGPKIIQIVDHSGKAIGDPRDLDGDGQLLPSGDAIVYPMWSDFEEIDFDDVPLLNAL